ncbi:MAG: gliding motility lipoprotein GldH [Flavobacteriales bacterium]|nr:gliding motility lipoprotein GldH [Flavobacteriales bacterium]
MRNKYFTTIFIVLVAFCCVFFYSCNHDAIYAHNLSIDNSWNKNTKLKYSFVVDDVSSKYDVFFIIRNNDEYKYTNLWLITSLNSKGKTIRIDTLQYDIADRKTGKWLGSGIFNKEIKALYLENCRFSKSGDYNIEVIQAMRDSNLIGIEDFGVQINKISKTE